MFIKIRTSRIYPIAYSLLTNDAELLLAKQLDEELNKVKSLQIDNYCYSVNTKNGGLIGFFCVPFNNPEKLVSVLYIKPDSRDSESKADFYKLISDTVFGEVTGSLSEFYMPNFDNELTQKITILDRTKFYAFNHKLIS